MFDVDDRTAGDAETPQRSIQAAEAILLGTPVYHGSHAGAVKDAINYCGFDEFENSTVGLLAVSGGSFPLTALDHLRAVCRSLEPWVLPYQAAIPRAREVIEN